MKILITGVAGFIGYSLTKELTNKGIFVYGIDNLNNYYDKNLKIKRIVDLGVIPESIESDNDTISTNGNFIFRKVDLNSPDIFPNIMSNDFDVIINLAAQVGVGYSIKNPVPYINDNILGFLNLLESVKTTKIKSLIFASSSSVYGTNKEIPYKISGDTSHPVSVYAASKKANELLAHSYHYNYNIPMTCLRFFTVYGPWGRPDMSYFKFTRAILEKTPIKLYNNGNMKRDFTFVSDIVRSIISIIKQDVENFNNGNISLRTFNIGHSSPVGLVDFVRTLEEIIGQNAIIEFVPLPKGEVLETFSDNSELKNYINYEPETNIKEGLSKFYEWFEKYYKV